MKYTHRKSGFSKTQSINLTDSNIHLYDENNILTNSFRYDDIKSITLVYTPIKSARKLHQCTIKTHDNKKIVMRSYSYVSPANFKEQTDDYLAILKLLHKKTESLENIQYLKGIKKTGYLAMLLFLVMMIILMIVISVVLFNKHKYSDMTTSIFGVIVSLFLTKFFITSFKPETYDPKKISKQALPFDLSN